MDPRAVARVVERISNPPKVNPELKALSSQEARILDLIAEGTDQPPDRRGYVSLGEDRQELHHGAASPNSR